MIVGECVSRGKGFSYDVNSSDEYFEMLNNIDLIKPLSDYRFREQEIMLTIYISGSG